MAKEERSISVWVATGLGAGYFPVAPGTAGSVVGLALVESPCRGQLTQLTGLGISLAALAAVVFAVAALVGREGGEGFWTC